MQEKTLSLREYFQKTGVKMNWFASHIGVSYSSIAKIVTGAEPTLSTANKIVEGTKGVVSYEKLMNSSKPKKT